MVELIAFQRWRPKQNFGKEERDMKGLTVTSHWWTISMLLLAIVVAGGIFLVQGQTAEATHINCGDTLNGGVHKLDQNLVCAPNFGPPSSGFGLRLSNGAELNMDGHSITCQMAGSAFTFTGGCIRLVSSATHVHNGTVIGGARGIFVQTGNEHRVHMMTVSTIGKISMLMLTVQPTWTTARRLAATTVPTKSWVVLCA